MNGRGKLYFGLFLDPLYKVHWNNRAGRAMLELECDGVLETVSKEFTFDDVKVDADIDPREFLINAKTPEKGGTFIAKVTYTVCDDEETFCKTITQSYEVTLAPIMQGSTRPGIFLFAMFKDVKERDANDDKKLTSDELPPGEVTAYMSHLDYDDDDVITFKEIDKFMTMFNNGAGITTLGDGR